MPITDLKSGGKMERMNFVRPVLNARCSCWSQTLFSCDIPDIKLQRICQNYLFLP